MGYRNSIGALALVALFAMPGSAWSFDDTRYPDLKGQWSRFIVGGLGGQPSFDQTKPWGFGQEAPLTPESRSILEASLAEQSKGGQGNFTGYACLAYGMPMMMTSFYPQEYVVTPETTHILINNADHSRRIFTDGRDWPEEIEPTYAGYSIGKWIDHDGDGRYDVLEVETRGPFKGPRVYDGTGLPLHADNQSIFKERIYLDKSDPNLLHDEITVLDHALTRPWTVDKRYRRARAQRPIWPEYVCGENNAQINIGSEYYFLSANRQLMPTRRDQPPPDLGYFRLAQSAAPPAQAPARREASFHLIEATIDRIHAAMQAQRLTCTQLIQAYLDRIAAYDQTGPKLNAIQTVNPNAMALAAKLDAVFRTSGPTGPLHCIPVLVKDEIETSFMPTTYGSAIFKHFTPPQNATIIDRLQGAGAIILAKVNMGEFAVGYSGTAFGDCRNAYDPTRDPGGSSCGTGVGVAANFGTVGIGEDTGGSIRGPASNESLVGLRPTLPLVSRFGLLPSTPTRDTLGPMTRTVRDAAIVLDVIAGYDPNDPVTADSYGKKSATYKSFLQRNGLRGLRIGVIRTAVGRDADPNSPDYREIQEILTQATRDLRGRGAEVVDPIVIPRLRELLNEGGNGIGETEAAVNAYFAQYPQAPLHTLKEIVDSPLLLPARRADLAGRLGHTTNELNYLKEQQARETLRRTVLKVMADNRLDLLAYAPAEREPAPIPANTTPGSIRRFAATLAYPALGVPAGYNRHALPIGIEFLGRPYSEGTLFRAAYDYERTTRHRRPPPTTPALPGEP